MKGKKLKDNQRKGKKQVGLANTRQVRWFKHNITSYPLYINAIGFFHLLAYNTRDIWKVLSIVFYLSNRFTNPIMFGIILKSYLSSMLWHNFLEDIIMQTQ